MRMRKKIRVEFLIVVIYAVLHVLLCCLHEGCFDEVHAWNIAKDGTLFEILFKVPYFEGHPSLWHLILVPFVKCGMQYKLSMLIVTTLFSVATVYVLEYKSPFPRLIKNFLPFSFFFFYQYGVIARPYCMMVLAFFILATLHNERDSKPVKYTLSLMFLSATTAFGTALAGGMAVVWLWKILVEYVKKSNKISSLLKDSRVYCLLALLAYAIFLLVRVLPLNPYGGMSYVGIRQNGILVRSLYLFCGLFSDLFFTNSYTHDFLADFAFEKFEYITACLFGAAILFGIIYIARRIKNLSEFVIPYIALSVFSVLVYFGVHNSGILFVFLVYWFWISWDRINTIFKVEGTEDKDRKVKLNPVLIGIIFMALPLFWSVSASITDINNTYSFGEKEADFLKENGLENSSICFEWKTKRDESKAGTLDYYDMKHIINMDRLYAYLDNPTYVNWPFDYSLYTFFHNKETDDENAKIIENIRQNPKPDVLMGEVDLKMVNGQDYDILTDYVLAYKGNIVKPWKSMNFEDDSVIYVKKDLIK